ncbi:GGDEF domain-containing protein [Pseudomarimonas arenosa]|uniref:diguanylate cyclase n=1 Tax=Pseudomarimonas arenosa TaxID=2774145 RepID=A0AAW3ZQT0_9GAMM|nr:diguanylate cyclase [Pseudomarimonas arenosa]MBD8528083.1 diguanylate cyclase [Pseudomarimonas arenosa]
MSQLGWAPLLLAAACALALGFRRYRLAWAALLLAVFDLALQSPEPRAQLAGLRFLPWVLLLAVSLPEGRLLSRRHAALAVFCLLLLGSALDAPEALFYSLSDFLAWPFHSWRPERSAQMFIGLAAGVALARWVWRGSEFELGLCLALLTGLPACRWGGSDVWLSVAALLLMLAILHGSHRMAFADQLTGLPNRRALDETLSRLSGEYALAMIDIDHFKSFNDSHGHDAGDRVLQAVAKLLRRHAGGEAFRFGGEEFCVVYPGRRSQNAMHSLEAARVALESRQIEVKSAGKKGPPRPKQVQVTMSAGLATRSDEKRQAHDVLQAADQALYKAKKAGRNKVINSR